VLASLAVLATSTVLSELGLPGGVGTKLVALAIIAGLIVLAGVVGFDLIMRLQTAITIVTGVLTGPRAAERWWGGPRSAPPSARRFC
jgi:hypothetical protein